MTTDPYFPTPISDLLGAAVGAARGDGTSVGCSLLGMVPYVGDAAKAGKAFTRAQKKKILEANRKKNAGKLRSDQSGKPLVPSKKSEKGVTPPENEAQVDHVYPRSKGGTNDPSNAQVLSRSENRAKSNKTP